MLMKNLITDTGLEHFFSRLKDIFATKEELKKATQPPTSYRLDVTSTPWTIYFDNGSSLQCLNSPVNRNAYGYGIETPISTESVIYPLTANIMNFARGTLTLETLKNTTNGANYWSPETTITNPVNDDASSFDFINARFKNTGSTSYTERNQRHEIRVFYELGLLTESEILELGAVRK